MSGNRQPAVNNRPLSERPWLFQRGTSGDPTGRTASKDIAALARKYAPHAIRALVEALDDPWTRAPAAVALLNRGYGLPTLPIEGGAQNISFLHLVAAREISERLQAELQAEQRNGTALPVIDGTAETSTPAEMIDLMKPALE
jgi:hypothetical protein